jgi:HEPN domain-containing protein
LGVLVTEAAYDTLVDDFSPYGEAVNYLNQLFATRGIVYRFAQTGQAEWHGDPGAYEQTLEPALAALSDQRLDAAAREFRDALNALRRGDRVGVKNAIRDASNAVEATMKALLDAREIERPERETADNLWDELHRNGVVSAKTKEEVCGPSHLRNSYGGHGPDPARDEPVPEGVAELAVMTAAGGIVYLAQLLP